MISRARASMTSEMYLTVTSLYGSVRRICRTFSLREASLPGMQAPNLSLIFSARSSEMEHSVRMSPVMVFPPKGMATYDRMMPPW